MEPPHESPIADLCERSASTVAHAAALRATASTLVLVSRNLRRGDPDPWRSVRVSGGDGAPETPSRGGPPGRIERWRGFEARPEHVRAVRSFVDRAALATGVDREPAVLAASEVATNVVRHVATSFAVTVVGWPGHLRVEFADRSRALPAVQRTPVGEHGRGLLILDAITDRWGVEPTPGGKVVWFEVSDRASAS